MDSPETNQRSVSSTQIAKLKTECAETGKSFDIKVYNVRNLYEQLLFNSVNKNSIFTPFAGIRLLIPFICNIDKGLYIDCDFIILKSLEDIYNQNIENDFLLAHLTDERLFSSGVYLYNIKKERENDFLNIKKAISFYINNSSPYPDQDALNFAYEKVNSLKLKKIFMYDKNAYMFHISSKHMPEIIDFLANSVFSKRGRKLHNKYHNIAQIISRLENDTSENNILFNN